MRFFPTEPDIATLFNRIEDGDIDLQPDFQRGEIWSTAKQQRLIDTILRGWVVPPILLIRDISSGKNKQLVLDGQQRLAAIRDFKRNIFGVDGKILPSDKSISTLHGLRYATLPVDVKKMFDRAAIRIYEVTDFNPDEPAEIFYRLNQPTALTSAEKRNAFIGPVRDQIRDASRWFIRMTDASKSLGFSNSRMAYDEVFARFIATLDLGTLRTKVTASGINDLYRRTSPLDQTVSARFEYTIKLAASVIEAMTADPLPTHTPKLNKATLYSWLVFWARLNMAVPPSDLARFLRAFEHNRTQTAESANSGSFNIFIVPSSAVISLSRVYTDRATARVSDVSSVLLRDFALWVSWSNSAIAHKAGCVDPAYAKISEFTRAAPQYHNEVSASDFIDHAGWGKVL